MDTKVILDTVWVLLAAMLVFFMNLGFGCVEAGMARSKNCVNILSKNFVVFACSTIGFWVIGWGLMFGNGSGFIGKEGLWLVSGVAADGTLDNSPATGADYKGPYSAISWTGVPLWAKFFFQLVFCGTAATIVSGAVAERVKYIAFILFSFVMAMFIYPVVGMLARGFVVEGHFTPGAQMASALSTRPAHPAKPASLQGPLASRTNRQRRSRTPHWPG